MLGVLFAILAAASFGLNSATVRRGTLRGSAFQGTLIAVALGLPLFVVAAAVTGQLTQLSAFTPRGYLLLASVGIFHLLFGRYCIYRAIAIIGANRSAPVLALVLPYSVGMAVLLLGEEVPPLVGAGILLMMAGPALSIEHRWRRRPSVLADIGLGEQTASSPAPIGAAANNGAAAASSATAGAAPLRQLEGYLFTLGAVVSHGTSPLLIRSALLETNLGVLGGLVSYATAGAALAIFLLVPGRLTSLQAMPRTAGHWFLASGFTVFVAQMFRFLALGAAPVTIVTPLLNTSILFIPFFARLINRRAESFSPRLLAGIGLSIAGGILLVRAL